jgi:hypothetical protein
MLIGAYIMGIVFSFVFIGFFVGLGGRNEDLWKPFVYSLIWPIGWFLFLRGKM